MLRCECVRFTVKDMTYTHGQAVFGLSDGEVSWALKEGLVKEEPDSKPKKTENKKNTEEKKADEPKKKEA